MPPKPRRIMPQIMPKILHMVALHYHHTATSACSLKYQAQNYLALGSSITEACLLSLLDCLPMLYTKPNYLLFVKGVPRLEPSLLGPLGLPNNALYLWAPLRV